MGKTLKLGILGSSLSHTKSPQMQMAGLKFLGIDGTYEKFEIGQNDFKNELNNLLSKVDGLNITIPYKETILKYLNKVDPLVERIGATNTIKIHDNLIEGFNTDYYGFKTSLEEVFSKKGDNLKGKKIAIIGAGGSAKAIIMALEDLQVAEINVYVRNIKKNIASLPRMKKTDLHLKLHNSEVRFDEMDLLINTTPVGQGRLSEELPIELPQLASLGKNAVVYDLIYSDTQLLKEARKLDLESIDGSRMLILQGVKSLCIWTHKKESSELVAAMSKAFHKVKAVNL